MTEFRSDLMRLLQTRGHIYQATDAEGLDALAAKESVTGYIGFDCTGPSLHVGSLVQIMTLRRLQQTGHKPIVIMGGGTTKIGDPSDKTEARPMLDDATIEANKASILRIFEKFLTFGDGPTDAIMVDNADWLDGLRYIPFLRETGRHFSINRMLGLESVKQRLDREQSLSFLEFNYMILQAYDFVELYKRHACRVQFGGSEQWSNIVAGMDLGRRMEGVELFGLTSPLVTTADGAKMGKTADGAVWLLEDFLPAYDYWQFWRNTHDADVGRFLRLFTELPEDEIARLETLEGAELNEAKKTLANEATAMAHGEAAARDAAATAEKTFEQGAIGEDLPTHSVGEAEIALVDALVALELVASRGEAKRLIRGGGARVDGEQVQDESAIVAIGDSPVRISAGKKKHGRLVRG
ncbi:MAG: tyrosine--tRNA ligase [Sphingomonadales bacterium]|nr:tyrosine--tRNA ligase [Sphingomonadales bacterium]